MQRRRLLRGITTFPSVGDAVLIPMRRYERCSAAQCNSFLLHSIVNDRDQELVRRLVPESAGALLKELPSLPSQQAILIGIATEFPLVVNMKELPVEQRPRSRNPDLWDVWTGQRPLEIDFDAIVPDWRS
jgi:uncharacterized protein